MIGYDAGVHQVGDRYLVVSTDPCTGVPEEWLGWLLIHYAASDVALFGATPEFCTINLLGPPSTKPYVFQRLMKEICDAAEELNMTIVRGHTGTYQGITSIIGVCTAYGMLQKEKLITPGGAKPGDLIYCTKSVGLETLINFSFVHKTLSCRLLGAATAEKLASLVKMESCVEEALRLSKIDGVHAMHDATEGGLTSALNEMAEASRRGFKIEFEKLPISSEMKILVEHFRLSEDQLLSMSSTGTLIAAIDPRKASKAEALLHMIGVPFSLIGVFTKRRGCEIIKDGVNKAFPKVADDPYERILSGKV